MLTAKVDRSKLIEKLRKLRGASPEALDAHTRAVGRPLAERMWRGVRRDTRRYARGWAMAFNGAGLGPLPVEAVVAGSFGKRAMILERLEFQLIKWERLVARYEAQGRYDKWYRQAVKTRDRAKEELAKWVQADGKAIAIFGGKGRKLSVTVRPTIYGGEGFVQNRRNGIVRVMRNKEAHASIVERKYRDVAFMVKAARALGVRAGRAAYRTVMKQAAA